MNRLRFPVVRHLLWGSSGSGGGGGGESGGGAIGHWSGSNDTSNDTSSSSSSSSNIRIRCRQCCIKVILTALICYSATLCYHTNVVVVGSGGGGGRTRSRPTGTTAVSLTPKFSTPQRVYSIARTDRFGSVARDMLLAHAYAFAHNLTYGGACPASKSLGNPLQYRRRRSFTTTARQLHMSSLLYYTSSTVLGSVCPLTANDYDGRHQVIPRLQYMYDDVHLFTPAWRASARSAVALDVVSVPVDVDSVTASSVNATHDIVVHIRRGDADPCYTRKHSHRYLSNNHYVRLIDESIQEYYDSHNISSVDPRDTRVSVTIYSESTSFEPFDVFYQRGYPVHLDSSMVDCWSHMMRADVLILSRSSFSYVPAVLNTGRIVYTPFDTHPLPHWRIVSDAALRVTRAELDVISAAACAVSPRSGNHTFHERAV